MNQHAMIAKLKEGLDNLSFMQVDLEKIRFDHYVNLVGSLAKFESKELRERANNLDQIEVEMNRRLSQTKLTDMQQGDLHLPLKRRPKTWDKYLEESLTTGENFTELTDFCKYAGDEFDEQRLQYGDKVNTIIKLINSSKGQIENLSSLDNADEELINFFKQNEFLLFDYGSGWLRNEFYLIAPKIGHTGRYFKILTSLVGLLINIDSINTLLTLENQQEKWFKFIDSIPLPNSLLFEYMISVIIQAKKLSAERYEKFIDTYEKVLSKSSTSNYLFEEGLMKLLDVGFPETIKCVKNKFASLKFAFQIIDKFNKESIERMKELEDVEKIDGLVKTYFTFALFAENREELLRNIITNFSEFTAQSKKGLLDKIGSFLKIDKKLNVEVLVKAFENPNGKEGLIDKIIDLRGELPKLNENMNFVQKAEEYLQSKSIRQLYNELAGIASQEKERTVAQKKIEKKIIEELDAKTVANLFIFVSKSRELASAVPIHDAIITSGKLTSDDFIVCFQRYILETDTLVLLPRSLLLLLKQYSPQDPEIYDKLLRGNPLFALFNLY